jgi:hypothetical protein
LAVLTRSNLRIDAVTSVPAEQVECFLGLYRESFGPLEIQSAARQSLTDDEFRGEMAHPSVVKFVASIDDDPVGLMFFSTDLSILPWISEPYFAHHFGEYHGRQAIYYFGGLLVQPAHRGGRVIKALFETGARAVAADDALVAFDCCAFNVLEVRLPEMIAMIGGRVCDLTPKEIDTQHYYAYELRNPR